MKARAMNLTGELLPPALVGVMVLVDKSGSMRRIRQPMEDAYTQFLNQQRAENPTGMWVTLHQFDSDRLRRMRYTPSYNRMPLAEAGPLRLHPSGDTPLRDALWKFAHAAQAIIDDPADETERLLLVIITDGEENSSVKHSWEDVRTAVNKLEDADCELIWLGASAAVLEAEEHIPTFSGAGASLAYEQNADGVAYATSGLLRSASAFRVGSSARSAMHTYKKETPWTK